MRAFLSTNLQNSSRVLAARTSRTAGTAMVNKSCKTVLSQAGFSKVKFILCVPLSSPFKRFSNGLLGCRQMAPLITSPEYSGGSSSVWKMASSEAKFSIIRRISWTEKIMKQRCKLHLETHNAISGNTFICMKRFPNKYKQVLLPSSWLMCSLCAKQFSMEVCSIGKIGICLFAALERASFCNFLKQLLVCFVLMWEEWDISVLLNQTAFHFSKTLKSLSRYFFTWPWRQKNLN